MGVQEVPPLLRPSDQNIHTPVGVRNSLEDRFPKDGPHPFILVDVSMFIVPALRRVDASKPILESLPF
jgi:hypothetical protein